MTPKAARNDDWREPIRNSPFPTSFVTMPSKQCGSVVAFVLIGIAAAALLATVAYTGYFQLARGAADASLVAQARAVVQQAAYRLAVEAADVDGDGYMEAPTMGAGSKVPTAGGVVPASSAAPKTDSWGTALGYCSWDNGAGSRNSSAGRITGDSDSGTSPAVSANSVVLAVVSAGPNKTFDTTCATARTGAAGDDVVQRFTHAQIVQGMGGTAYFGDPVTAATLSGINPGATRDGQLRLQKDTNTLMRWDNAASAWKQVDLGGSFGTIALKNAVINGYFAFWQRGDGGVSAGVCDGKACYTADRWLINGSSTSDGGNFAFMRAQWSRVNQSDGTFRAAPGQSKSWLALGYGFRATTPRAVDTPELVTQRIEDATTFAGQTVTASFWIRTSNATSRRFCFDLVQFYGTGSPAGKTSVGFQCYTASTTWTQQVFTVTLPPVDVAQLRQDHALWFRAVMERPEAGQWPVYPSTGQIEFGEAQLVVGRTASDLELRPMGLETLLVQRYFESGRVGSVPANPFSDTNYCADNPPFCYRAAVTEVHYKVPKRAAVQLTLKNNTPSDMVPWCAGHDTTKPGVVTNEYYFGYREGVNPNSGGPCVYFDLWYADAELNN
ncbi:hypothetical protein E4K72_03575 [Oxalobacteraceae bacterium OM1]|nr:hypothetical protein E4K72_03575 [Oxalobacteraceae bacterium OM1]